MRPHDKRYTHAYRHTGLMTPFAAFCVTRMIFLPNTYTLFMLYNTYIYVYIIMIGMSSLSRSHALKKCILIRFVFSRLKELYRILVRLKLVNVAQ